MRNSSWTSTCALANNHNERLLDIQTYKALITSAKLSNLHGRLFEGSGNGGRRRSHNAAAFERAHMFWLRNHVHGYGRVWGAYTGKKGAGAGLQPLCAFSSCTWGSCYVTCCDHLLMGGEDLVSIRCGHEAKCAKLQEHIEYLWYWLYLEIQTKQMQKPRSNDSHKVNSWFIGKIA